MKVAVRPFSGLYPERASRLTPESAKENVECRFTKDKPTISNKYPCVFPACPFYGMFN